jgi:hypothetical protein
MLAISADWSISLPETTSFLLPIVKAKSSKPSDLKASFLTPLRWSDRDPHHDPHPVLTFRQMMKIVVDYTGRFRPIVALPWVVGELQAEVMQLLPQNIFTITRDQVCSRSLNR